MQQGAELQFFSPLNVNEVCCTSTLNFFNPYQTRKMQSCEVDPLLVALQISAGNGIIMKTNNY